LLIFGMLIIGNLRKDIINNNTQLFIRTSNFWQTLTL